MFFKQKKAEMDDFRKKKYFGSTGKLLQSTSSGSVTGGHI